MINQHKASTSLTLLLAGAVLVVPMLALAAIGPKGTPAQIPNKGMAVAYPWVFDKGTHTSRMTAMSSAEEIGRKAEYALVSNDTAAEAWKSGGYPVPTFGHLPTRATLVAYGKQMKVSKVIYGSVAWHTRSVWVNAGPKTISTATVNTYVLDVATGKVVYRSRGVEGRSDERSTNLKIAAAVLFTPLVTAAACEVPDRAKNG